MGTTLLKKAWPKTRFKMKRSIIFIMGIFLVFLIVGNISALSVTPISIENCDGADIDRNGIVSVEDINLFNDERLKKCGHLHPLNALNVINYLNSDGPGEAYSEYEYLLDTNADGFVSPIDALILINRMNFCTDLPSVPLASNADFDKNGFIQGDDVVIFLGVLEVYPIGINCMRSLDNLEIFVSTGKDVYSVGEKIELN
jgi:hypothetical protein